LDAPLFEYGSVEDIKSQKWLFYPQLSASLAPSEEHQATVGLDQIREAHPSQYAQVQFLDMDCFFTSLMTLAICLRRTAGFRRADVEEVLKGCLVPGPIDEQVE